MKQVQHRFGFTKEETMPVLQEVLAESRCVGQLNAMPGTEVHRA